MTRSKKIALAALGAVAVLSLTLSGCSSKATDTGSSSTDGVKTGVGISGNIINIGIVLDQSGPFQVLSSDHERGEQLFWDQLNAKGGVGGKFKVKLNLQDNGYDVQKSVTAFNALEPTVLGFADFVGSSQTEAILNQAEADDFVITPVSPSAKLSASQNIVETMLNYNDESSLLYQWLVDGNKIQKSDTVAEIYIQGDYGSTAYAGTQQAAKEYGATALGYQIAPNATDVSADVQEALSKGAKAFFLAGTPTQTASLATALQSAGVNLPIVGNNPSLSPTLLSTPAAKYLEANYFTDSTVTTYESGPGANLYKELTAKFPGAQITNQAAIGYVTAYVFDQILEKAYKDGNLTRQGVLAARKQLTTIDTNGLSPDLNVSISHLPQSVPDGAYIVQLDPSVTGGIKEASNGVYTLK